MDKFSLDFADLQNKLSTKKIYRLADVAHRLKKVAFDVVRFVDSDKIDELWKIERDGDEEYIVAMYDESAGDQTKTASENPWNALPDAAGAHINVFFKGQPIKRLAMADFGLPPEEAYAICGIVKNKFASNADFLRNFVNELTADERSVLTDAEPSIFSSK